MEVKYYTEPFKLKEIPLKDIYVIDNWCPQDLWDNFCKLVHENGHWNFTNNVTWEDVGTTEITWMYPFYTKHKKPYGNYSRFVDPIIDKMCEDFGFEFQQFDYAGINGQTTDQQGTIHKDNYRKKNLSIMWHMNPEWGEHWKGAFRVYKKDAIEQGQRGFSDRLVQDWQIAQVEYKPNRLIIMDGSYPHSADAPSRSSGFTLRKTLVVFGNSIKLVDK
jgi:hypothetical protein